MFNEITEKLRIKNLLELVERSGSIVHLRNDLNEYAGTLTQVTDNYISFYSKFKISSLKNEVTINFIYSNQYYYFNTRVINTDNNIIFLDIPDEIFIHIKRRHKRYNVLGFDVKAKIKIISIQSRTSNIAYSIENKNLKKDSPIIEEYKKEVPDIKKMLKNIMEELKEKFDLVSIKFQSNIDKRDIIYNILKLTKKPFYINNTLLRNSYLKNPDYPAIVSYKDYIDLLTKEGVEKSKIENFINKRIEYYKHSRILSELYVPILLQDEFLGFIQIANRSNIIDKINVNYVKEIVNIFTESIIKAKLNSISEEAIQLKIKDISLSGIGAMVYDELLIETLQEESKLLVDLYALSKNISKFIAVIKRKIKRKNYTELGMEITEIEPKEERKFNNFIDKYLKHI